MSKSPRRKRVMSKSLRRRKSMKKSRRKSKSKSKVRISLKKGGLPGYHMKDSMNTRHKTLLKIAKQNGAGNVIKKLNVLSIFNKNNHPNNAAIFRKDMKFVQNNA